MPQETPSPMTLVHSHEIVKFRIFTDLNKKRIGTFREEVPITVSTTARATGNRLRPHSAQRKPMPNTHPQEYNEAAPYLFPEHETSEGAAENKQYPKREPPPNPSRVQGSVETSFRHAFKSSRPVMLNRPSQITQPRQTRARPAGHVGVPPKPNSRSTSNK